MHLAITIQDYVFYIILLVFSVWNTINTYKVRNEIGLEYKSKKHDIKISNKPALVILIILDILLVISLISSLIV